MIKTTSLKTAKLLKEAGFTTNDGHTEMYWVNTCTKGWCLCPVNEEILATDGWLAEEPHNCFSAPTTDELLEELPKQIVNKDGMAQWLKIKPIGNDWMVVYDPVDEGCTDNFIWCGETKTLLCEALAKMWLWLKKEGLLKG